MLPVHRHREEIRVGTFENWLELVVLPLYGKARDEARGQFAEEVIRFELKLLREKKIDARLPTATLVLSKMIDRKRLEAMWEEIKMLDIVEIAREKGMEEGKILGMQECKILGQYGGGSGDDTGPAVRQVRYRAGVHSRRYPKGPLASSPEGSSTASLPLRRLEILRSHAPTGRGSIQVRKNATAPNQWMALLLGIGASKSAPRTLLFRTPHPVLRTESSTG
jgi:hypothetical protein